MNIHNQPRTIYFARVRLDGFFLRLFHLARAVLINFASLVRPVPDRALLQGRF